MNLNQLIYILMVFVSGQIVSWDPVNRCNDTSWVTVVPPTDRPNSVRNRCVIKAFGGVFVLSRWVFFYFSRSVGDFVIGLS